MSPISPWWPAAAQTLLTVVVSIVIWTKLHEDQGSPRRRWRSIVTIIAALAGIVLPMWSAMNAQMRDQRDDNQRASLINELGDANRLARKAATQHGKPMDLSPATQGRIGDAISHEPIPSGRVEVLCLPGGEANEKVCDELAATFKNSGWAAVAIPNVMLFDGGGSGGIRILSSQLNMKLASTLAKAMRREGLDARSELAEAGDKRPIAIIVNHV